MRSQLKESTRRYYDEFDVEEFMDYLLKLKEKESMEKLRYKLIKEYPGSPVNSIFEYWTDGISEQITDGNTYIPLSLVKKYPEFWQKQEPLFYTEDFRDGSFPKESCSDCDLSSLTVSIAIHCGMCNGKNGWVGELKGEPIYEGDESYRIGKWYSRTFINSCNSWAGFDLDFDPTVKMFANETNAQTYFNKLKWQDKLKFKVGDSIVTNWTKSIFKIESIDYYKERYNHGNNVCTVFRRQSQYELYKEPKLEVGKWYQRSDATDEYILYSGLGPNKGLYEGKWYERYHVSKDNIAVLEPANMDKVNDLLLQEAKKRYPVGTKFKFEGVVQTVEEPAYLDGENIHVVSPRNEWGSYGCSNPRVYEDGKWSEIVEPKFITANGVKVYTGDKPWAVNVRTENAWEYILKEKTQIHKEYVLFSTRELAQQYLAEQIAKKRGIEVGTELFCASSFSYYGNGTYLGRATKIEWFEKSKRVSITVDKMPDGEPRAGLHYFRTLEELAKEEGLEVGMKLDNDLLMAYNDELNLNYNFSRKYEVSSLKVPTNRTHLRDILNGKPCFHVNGADLPIIGFKKFKEEWESKKRIEKLAEDFKKSYTQPGTNRSTFGIDFESCGLSFTDHPSLLKHRQGRLPEATVSKYMESLRDAMSVSLGVPKELFGEKIDIPVEYNVGDWVIVDTYSKNFDGKPLKITRIDYESHGTYCYFIPNGGMEDKNFAYFRIKRLASKDEIIEALTEEYEKGKL